MRLEVSPPWSTMSHTDDPQTALAAAAILHPRDVREPSSRAAPAGARTESVRPDRTGNRYGMIAKPARTQSDPNRLTAPVTGSATDTTTPLGSTTCIP